MSVMAAPGPLRLAVFDVDGTLLDSAASIVDGVTACWLACGFAEPDPLKVRRIIGLPWEESIAMLIPGSGEPELAAIHNYYDEVARGVRPPAPRAEIRLFPGALDTLAALEAAGYLLGIITSRPSDRLTQLLDEQGIGNRFVSLKTTDHGPGKPNPHLMLQTLAETGTDKENTVMVGDTTFDILMARNAGTAAVGVSWGVHESAELLDAGAHHVVDRFDDVAGVIHRLIGT